MVHSLFRYTIKTLTLIFLLSTSSVSLSAVVSGLLHSRVEVISQQAADRQEAFNRALVKTLLKISGHRDLVFNSDIQNTFFPAERYVQSFSYKENPRYIAYLEYKKQIAGVSEITKIDSSTFDPVPLPYLLEVDFAAQALEAKMEKSNLPIWGNVRPEIMFWVLIESEGVRELIGSENPSSFNDELFKLSNDYALPVAIPLSDEFDLKALNMSDLWGLFPDAIDQAKVKYASNGNLMMRIYKSSSNTWSANWLFSISGISYTGQLHNSSVSVITDEVMSFLSIILSKRFSISSTDITGIQDITLEIINVNNFKDYIDIQTFLDGLSPVKSFSLDWLEGSVMSISLALNGSPEQLQEYLGLSGKLKFISSSTNEILSDPVVLVEGFSDEKQNEADLVEPIVTNRFVRIEKYKWLSTTLEPIKK